jgi:hypothetical protein
LIIVNKSRIFEKEPGLKTNKHIEIKRSGRSKDTFDCLITLKEISPQFLLILRNELDNLIRAQSKNFEGWVVLSSNTSKQLQDLNQLIRLREELTSEIVKNT